MSFINITFLDGIVAVRLFVRMNYRAQRSSLFRFESSLHSISLNESMNESNKMGIYDTNSATDKLIVVEPNARRVMEIYQPLMKFVHEIEVALGYDKTKY